MVSIAFTVALTFLLMPGLAFAGIQSLGWIAGYGNMAIGATIGGISGAANAALTGGNIGDVLRGAAVGAIQGAISSGPLHNLEAGAQGLSMGTAMHVVGHGAVGGAANVAMGGKFQDGFVSAASSAFAGDMGWNEGATRISRTIKAGIIGGTVSALGGGKFANGAYTSAFQHLLNREFTHTYEGLAPFDPNDPTYTFQCDSACHGIDETGRFYDIQNGVTTFTYNSWNFSSSGGMQDASVPIIEYIVAGGVGRAIFGLLSKTASRAWSLALTRAAKGGASNLGKVSDDILEWVGPKSTMSKPPGGSDLILRSSDGTKQIRFDLTNPHGLQPHVNVETFVPRNLFPGDRKMIQTVNEHVFPKP